MYKIKTGTIWIPYVVLPIILGTLSIFYHPRAATWREPDLANNEILPEALINPKESILWIDARESIEYEAGHVEFAISLNSENFEQNLPHLLERWSPNDKIVVYCDTKLCDDSQSMAKRLEDEVGLHNIWVLHGGWIAWLDEIEQ